jgi:predicted DNA-binding helix-hairpin-helix protein
MFGLYGGGYLKRVYFSAYQKGLGSPDIPGERQFLTDPGEQFVREHRLYQVDFLLRKYGFREEDILLDKGGNLRLDRDPKQVWADCHPDFYPVRINTADREALLRVPGLGPETVKRALRLRRERRIGSIKDLGLRGKRADISKGYLIFE